LLAINKRICYRAGHGCSCPPPPGPKKPETPRPRPAADAVTGPAAGPRGGRAAPPARAAAQDEDELDDGNRRRALIEGAARLFRHQGFDATSTRDIAAAAGMHSGSPFYHFESKSALLYAVMDEGMALALHSQKNALALLPATAGARERLRVLVRHHFEILLGPHSDFIPVMLYDGARSARPARRHRAVKDGYETLWMPVLQALAEQARCRPIRRWRACSSSAP
jgi:AcrR family transcriptional regulator